jgi:hypothetical protein
MLKKIFLTLAIPAVLGSCTATVTTRPYRASRVQPSYVASCPQGYAYDSYTRDCVLRRGYY